MTPHQPASNTQRPDTYVGAPIERVEKLEKLEKRVDAPSKGD